jgi:arylsulfatase A-like enzyme
VPRIRPRLRLLLALAGMVAVAVAAGLIWRLRPWQRGLARGPASRLPRVDARALDEALAAVSELPLSAADTDVLVALVCTFRRDRVQPYGQERPTTPFLGQLAEHGVLFEHAVVQSPWTRPSTGSLLTGRWAGVLQLDHPGPEGFQNRALADRFTTLAELLQARGFHTIGASGNPNISTTFGFQQGFDAWHEPEALWRNAEGPPPSGDKLVDALLAELDASPAARRVYLQAFFVDTHTPRQPPRQALRAVAVPGLETNRRVLVYDAALRTLDAHLARLFVEVKARRPNLLFVVVGDHGEGLNLPREHGRGHGNHLYTTTTEVPLLWHHPALHEPGRRVGGLAMGVDLVPTVLDLLGEPAPGGLDGASQAAAVRGDAREASHALAFSETQFRRSDKTAVIGEGYHLIRDHLPGGQEGIPTLALYARGEALEAHDVAAAHPEALGDLAEALDAWERGVAAATTAAGPPVEAEPSATQIEQLKTLGYIE